MTDADIARYRSALEDELARLTAEDALGAEGQKTVTLDQQSVGRLSRMDALQGQAMARATQARRGARRSRIAAALARIEAGEFGYCTECGEDIAPKRLALDATVPTCITCANG
ncbi:TraR/DksA family transcriptional regulator [Maritimibacter fusiformis]|uniref:TraR/DksA family transcriptional regulator n=1 Tax=Maritimibacter fusiformis TaxID=2603819 RepID=A0A5D0RN13_9RHOB|nr:TraR/DksA C4-type zinc finger protein [Maritimibacter fusiformis]TYB82873.1 TraR/DksA family transcriptional regulator [Maritimibacter fusiformis]